MFPPPMSRTEFRPDDSHLELSRLLEQHILAGFPPDLCLDLVLNELVVRAAEATRASAAAIALTRGDEMVCRAATGELAPDLGVPLSTRDGLSGACLQTRQPQLSVDTEFDPRVDPAVSRRIGIRSILIVPIFESVDENNTGEKSKDRIAPFAGVLEVFSSSPAAFSHADQKRLEGFAEDCVRIRRAAADLSQRKSVPAVISPEVLPAEGLLPGAPRTLRRPYEAWTLALGALAILATISVSFLIGSRIGWLRAGGFHAQSAQSTPAGTRVGSGSRMAAKSPDAKSTRAATAKPAIARAPEDELVVYEKGKVVFRMKPAPAQGDTNKSKSDSIVEASSTTRMARFQSIWLAPSQAESRLLSRTEPQYPTEALAEHRVGNVVLEVQVAEDGSVASVRALSGDPLLTPAAADAVRSWRYQPYRLHDRPAQFQTDVTLSFALPD
ncbi:MAG TPA: TonB family protein [Terriglobales bacterium]|nr:TonB family protein [Terriglobales bacterium]